MSERFTHGLPAAFPAGGAAPGHRPAGLCLTAAPSGAKDMTWELVGGIFLAALFVVALYFGLKWLSKKSFFMNRGSYMRIVDRISLSKDAYLALVEVGGKLYGLCVTRDGASVFDSFEWDELTKAGDAQGGEPERSPEGTAPVTGEGDSFLTRFRKHFMANLRAQFGLKPKEAPSAQRREPPPPAPPEREESGPAAPDGADSVEFSEILREKQEPYGAPPRARRREPEPDDMDALMERISEKKDDYSKRTKRE